MVPGAPNAEAVGLNKDHVGLAKFEREGDGDFEILSRQLSQMAMLAPATNASRWESNQRPKGNYTHMILLINLLTMLAYRCRQEAHARSYI